MNSDDIRSKIDSAIRHEKKTKTTANHLKQRLTNAGIPWTPDELASCVNFITSYIRETPDLMDAVFQAATQQGIIQETTPIFNAAFTYWAELHDYIPDTLGLRGLSDDAYLTHMFLEVVSNLHSARSGHPLLSIDLGPPNRLMRKLIGEPIASALDAAVAQTVAGPMIQAGLQQLAGAPRLNFAGISNRTWQYQLQDQVNTQLGAMGVL